MEQETQLQITETQPQITETQPQITETQPQNTETWPQNTGSGRLAKKINADQYPQAGGVWGTPQFSDPPIVLQRLAG